MAYMTKDRFGNDKIIVSLKDKKGSGYPKGYLETHTGLWKVEVSKSNKEGIEGYVSLTKVNRNNGGGGNTRKVKI
ncbi:hypothetical protein GWK08_08840 [Leptobacterium flavescens]|uniref:Uncharacterized protein n=1 Tax=Leptobacterium flavescens TaxID=472055 RepID=A0A6P0UM74_9FLAO|nr:hypothetical protein [Leptobacterium flavescens]NER13540.1 hypothetical protein [Leptobacterium flavescens]